MTDVKRLTPAQFAAALDDLATVLTDCVAGGASVSFMSPFSHADAKAWFASLSPAVENGTLIIMAAEVDGKLVGTVQVDLNTPPNQPHRAEVRKLLVLQSARRDGAAWNLMLLAEDEARKAGRTLLTLDTITGSPAEKLYREFGFAMAGVIPGYALMPDGGEPAPTTVLYKRIT